MTTPETSLDERILKLEQKLEKAKMEREAWRGKPSEHFKMASILVECLERDLEKLYDSGKSR